MVVRQLRRTEIETILVIGSGPIVIGQTCEYDQFALQACEALRERGYKTVFVNSNPATVGADPGVADAAYIEPLTPDSLTRIIEKERPDAILPIFGGQTTLNLVMELSREGALERFGVKVLGSDAGTIARAEDRRLFKEIMQAANLPVLPSGIAESIEEGMQVIRKLGFPAILRPAYTTAGAGSAVAYNIEEFVAMLAVALESSPIRQVLVESAVLGWKEIEIELLRDSAGSTALLTTAENIDPVGIHAGDSTVVLPPQTLSNEQKANLTRMASDVVNAIGVIGSASVRFALDPAGDEIVVIGANARAGRGTALASKVTGLPVARLATELALGTNLTETLPNGVPAQTEFTTVKMPRFTFERFPDADTTLGTSMKSIGEVIGIGRNLSEALQKAIRSLEIGRLGLGSDGRDVPEQERTNPDVIREMLAKPAPGRLFFIRYAIRNGMDIPDIASLSGIAPEFIESIRKLLEFEENLCDKSLVSVTSEVLAEAKALGYSDAQLAVILETDEEQVRLRRRVLGIEPSAGATDEACYSTYGGGASVPPLEGEKKVLVVGGGPNRIGQGSEFDYLRVQALQAISEEGYQSITINSNPDAVSTNPGLPGRLYIDPMTREALVSVIERERPMGAIVQFAGQTLLQITQLIEKSGVPILGTSYENVSRTRDRKQLDAMMSKLGLKRASNDAAISSFEVVEKAAQVGYPLLARAAREVGGQSAEIIYDPDDLAAFLASGIGITPERPLMMDRFLEGAIEVGVDAISDASTTVICGVMEFIEQAGVHPGDSACSIPPYSLPDETTTEIKRQVKLIAQELSICGLMSVQFAVKGDDIYVLEVHARASRTLPFTSKAAGVQWAKAAACVMLGKTLQDLGITSEVAAKHVSVKETVFPFARFANVDVVLGPEMRSTGEVMGLNDSFGNAYIKAQIAAGQILPEGGTAFVSVAGRDKSEAVDIGRKLIELGFDVAATKGTADALREGGVKVRTISKIGEGRPDAIDLIKNGEIHLVFNTPSGKKPRRHEITIRSAAVARGIPIVTTMAGAKATLFGMEAIRQHETTVRSLQEYNK